MSENIGVATGKIMLKIVIALFKGVWNVLTFGFKAYKGHRDKKDAEMREQLRQVTSKQQFPNYLILQYYELSKQETHAGWYEHHIQQCKY